MSKIMDTSDEWISSRTGIRERRLATEETTASMSIEAARRAMENAHVTPSAACEIQAEIGADHAGRDEPKRIA